jgi:hypothetical protein
MTAGWQAQSPVWGVAVVPDGARYEMVAGSVMKPPHV